MTDHPEHFNTPEPSYRLLTDEPPKSGAKTSKSIGLLAALAVGALIGGVSGAGVATWAITSNIQSSPISGAPTGPTTITVNDAANATQITAIAAMAGPAVVTVSVQGGNAGGTGSGVIITEDGYIVTNTHVVTLDGETAHPKIQVQSYDGHLYSADLIGTDPITDIAVIKIDGTFQPLQFADSSKLNVGDTAIAIGAPLGLANTVTNGIVSALNRSITVASSAAPKKDDSNAPDGNSDNGPFNFWEFPGPDDPQGESQQPSASDQASIFLPVIQTDAAINPGNSGGALLDSDGKVIGINVAIAGTGSSLGAQSGNIGVGFAIPSNLAKRVAFEIISSGTASHGLLGATVMDVTNDSAIATKTMVGASVQSVTSGGGADKAGIRKGDIVTGFNGLPITGSVDLTAQVRAAEAGSQATITYLRDGKLTTVTVTLGSLS
jgi:putative serine protease PepD